MQTVHVLLFMANVLALSILSVLLLERWAASDNPEIRFDNRR
jgi:hypothetical protein